jgi:dsDNA-binding SOS-regulon protein
MWLAEHWDVLIAIKTFSDLNSPTHLRTAYRKLIKKHGLDAGRASDNTVRSSAMWLAKNWESVFSVLNTITNHRPEHIRAECRLAGYEWASGSRR